MSTSSGLATYTVQKSQATLLAMVDAPILIVRSGEGLLRRTRNLCLGALLEAVRDQVRIVDLKQINRVLIQPHWRKDCDQPIA